MDGPRDFRLAELIVPLSLAGDAGAALPPETGLRTTAIALGLARHAGLDPEELRATYWAGLLRHLGCTATADEETRLMGDEQELRASLALVDAAKPAQMLVEAAKGFGRGKGPLTRARRVVGFMAGAPREAPRIFKSRCEVALRLGARLGLGPGALRALDDTYERFDGKGVPAGKRGDAIYLPARIIAVAEPCALLLKLPGGEDLAASLVAARAGGQFDPDIARLFARTKTEVLAAARAEALAGPVVDMEPAPRAFVPVERAVDVATVLADFADLKSAHTRGHSRAVAALVRAAAPKLDLDDEAVEALVLAALLHDLGRVGVSNAIWDKPGPLDGGEWAKVRQHPQVTESLLTAAAPWADVARLAASDHDRADGSGYPRAASPPQGPIAARLLAAADVHEALLETRAHRPAFAPAEAAKILEAEAAAGRLDRRAVQVILECVGRASSRKPAWPNGLTDREVEILGMLARGLVDKEIAARLGISHRTVHHHNQSIYSKLGVTTRGAAALFAIENGLVGS